MTAYRRPRPLPDGSPPMPSLGVRLGRPVSGARPRNDSIGGRTQRGLAASLTALILLGGLAFAGVGLSNYTWDEAESKRARVAMRMALSSASTFIEDVALSGQAGLDAQARVRQHVADLLAAMGLDVDDPTRDIAVVWEQRGSELLVRIDAEIEGLGPLFAGDDLPYQYAVGRGNAISEGLAVSSTRAEIALALDYSQSMSFTTLVGGERISGTSILKDAFSVVVDALKENTPGGQEDLMMVSVVPFASAVNVADLRNETSYTDDPDWNEERRTAERKRYQRIVSGYRDLTYAYGRGAAASMDEAPFARAVPTGAGGTGWDGTIDVKRSTGTHEGDPMPAVSASARDFFNGCVMARWGKGSKKTAKLPAWGGEGEGADVALHLGDHPPVDDNRLVAYAWPDARVTGQSEYRAFTLAMHIAANQGMRRAYATTDPLDAFPDPAAQTPPVDYTDQVREVVLARFAAVDGWGTLAEMSKQAVERDVEEVIDAGSAGLGAALLDYDLLAARFNDDPALLSTAELQRKQDYETGALGGWGDWFQPDGVYHWLFRDTEYGPCLIDDLSGGSTGRCARATGHTLGRTSIADRQAHVERAWRAEHHARELLGRAFDWRAARLAGVDAAALDGSYGVSSGRAFLGHSDWAEGRRTDESDWSEAGEHADVDYDAGHFERHGMLLSENRTDRGGARGCPDPILPLTADAEDFSTYANRLRVVLGNEGRYGPQTFLSQGVVWGLRALSPLWSDAWGVKDPREGRRPLTPCGSAPVDGCASDVNKVLVLVTDGDNYPGFKSRLGYSERAAPAFGPRGLPHMTAPGDTKNPLAESAQSLAGWLSEHPLWWTDATTFDKAFALDDSGRLVVDDTVEAVLRAYSAPWEALPGNSLPSAPCGTTRTDAWCRQLDSGLKVTTVVGESASAWIPSNIFRPAQLDVGTGEMFDRQSYGFWPYVFGGRRQIDTARAGFLGMAFTPYGVAAGPWEAETDAETPGRDKSQAPLGADPSLCPADPSRDCTMFDDLNTRLGAWLTEACRIAGLRGVDVRVVATTTQVEGKTEAQWTAEYRLPSPSNAGKSLIACIEANAKALGVAAASDRTKVAEFNAMLDERLLANPNPDGLKDSLAKVLEVAKRSRGLSAEELRGIGS